MYSFFFFLTHLMVNWVEWEDWTGRGTASKKERRKSNNTTVNATTKTSDINNDGATVAKTQQQMNQPSNWQNTILLWVPACMCACMCKKALDSTHASPNYHTLPAPPKPLALPQPPNPSTLESPLPPPWPPATVLQGGCLAGGQSPSHRKASPHYGSVSGRKRRAAVEGSTSRTGSSPIRVIHFQVNVFQDLWQHNKISWSEENTKL